MKVKNWELVEEVSADYEKLEPGGYVCRIVSVKDNERNEYLEIVWDVAEGEHSGFYSDDWGKDHPFAHNDRWYYGDKAERFFKSKLSALEQGNRGRFSVSEWSKTCDVNALVGLEIGLVLQKLLNTDKNGKDTEYLEVVGVYAPQDIRNGDYKLPEPRNLRGSGGSSGTTAAGPYDAAAADPYGDIPFI